MFPWLSTIAQNYERYKFQMLKFHFRTGAPTSTPGNIGMYVDYDATDPAPTSKLVAYANRNYSDGPIWANSTFVATREDLDRLPSYYVFDGNTTEIDHALDLSDLGVLNVITSMDSSPNLSGELFVEYEVRLMTPSPRPAPAAVTRLQTEDVVVTTTDPVSPFGADGFEFNSGISPLSDNIITWASGLAIQFATDFYGTLVLHLSGSSVTAGDNFYSGGGTGTTVTSSSLVGGEVDGDSLGASLIYQITANAGQYFTLLNVLSGAWATCRVIASQSKLGVHNH